ncbi:MAG: RNA-binding protein [Nitrospirae bacterium GWC2_46_6]|nr:MAG: RNA-binding protein [Nitrospirae bacterium GWA2_46_11]OGW22577.1 MAG: RNA-binding protein [Nitrospirae bacterium GWC2_46_6]OGW23361.1 MAG: RNA-binding protein [Nitrospirae bacterium GWB2_47_37]HAK87779.1 RNA-binding protein [Nitrospiraceae bacterium]HCZ11848.1 RNA-binding protein [Nitrospiraceae bacterium]
MAKKIYVGNLSFNATEADIKELFSSYGEVDSAKIITDAQTGRPRGFGFVEMQSDEGAAEAIAALNGKAFMERTLVVSEARPQQPKERGGFQRERKGFGGGRGRGGGGFGGGGRR